MPYSPNATRVPPLAVPCRSGRCCLRCAVLRGMSMRQPSPDPVATGSPVPAAPLALPALPAGREVSSRAAEAARALHPDPARAALHGRLHGLAHRAPERHPARQLLGHALGDQLRVDLRVLDLEDVELDLLAGELLQIAADPVGLGAAPP